MKTLPSRLLGLVPIVAAPLAVGYPLDGYDSTGISRLPHQRWLQESKLEGKKRPSSYVSVRSLIQFLVKMEPVFVDRDCDELAERQRVTQ